ncbi:hypothetical protein B9Z65_2549 [Elsinoe australis]|uniref:3'-5' exonuclease domain-containing protein n=1 Tax=Elsinoe australis TaxID=40998 RepID=A0A2P8A3Y0_9PEZI|nr:hypothetical protein B9Z65_2549 [Elsinoe australis]
MKRVRVMREGGDDPDTAAKYKRELKKLEESHQAEVQRLQAEKTALAENVESLQNQKQSFDQAVSEKVEKGLKPLKNVQAHLERKEKETLDLNSAKNELQDLLAREQARLQAAQADMNRERTQSQQANSTADRLRSDLKRIRDDLKGKLLVIKSQEGIVRAHNTRTSREHTMRQERTRRAELRVTYTGLRQVFLNNTRARSSYYIQLAKLDQPLAEVQEYWSHATQAFEKFFEAVKHDSPQRLEKLWNKIKSHNGARLANVIRSRERVEKAIQDLEANRTAYGYQAHVARGTANKLRYRQSDIASFPMYIAIQSVPKEMEREDLESLSRIRQPQLEDFAAGNEEFQRLSEVYQPLFSDLTRHSQKALPLRSTLTRLSWLKSAPSPEQISWARDTDANAGATRLADQLKHEKQRLNPFGSRVIRLLDKYGRDVFVTGELAKAREEHQGFAFIRRHAEEGSGQANETELNEARSRIQSVIEVVLQGARGLTSGEATTLDKRIETDHHLASKEPAQAPPAMQNPNAKLRTDRSKRRLRTNMKGVLKLESKSLKLRFRKGLVSMDYVKHKIKDIKQRVNSSLTERGLRPLDENTDVFRKIYKSFDLNPSSTEMESNEHESSCSKSSDGATQSIQSGRATRRERRRAKITGATASTTSDDTSTAISQDKMEDSSEEVTPNAGLSKASKPDVPEVKQQGSDISAGSGVTSGSTGAHVVEDTAAQGFLAETPDAHGGKTLSDQPSDSTNEVINADLPATGSKGHRKKPPDTDESIAAGRNAEESDETGPPSHSEVDQPATSNPCANANAQAESSGQAEISGDSDNDTMADTARAKRNLRIRHVTSRAARLVRSSTNEQAHSENEVKTGGVMFKPTEQKQAKRPSPVTMDDTAVDAKAGLSKDFLGEEPFKSLDYQLSEQAIAAARLRAKTDEAVYWSHSLYRSSSNEPVKVLYCTNKDFAQTVAKSFLNEPFVGFDMEWEAGMQQNFYEPIRDVKNRSSLVQVSAEDRIALFHIAMFPGKTVDELLPPALRQILESDSIIKVGVNIGGDRTRIEKCFGLAGKGFLELSHCYKLVKYSDTRPELVNKSAVGMDNQVKDILGLPLLKGLVRTSAWSKRLTKAQIKYAAADAYAGYRLFHELELRRQAMNPMPPRPAFQELEQPLVLADGTLPPKSPKTSAGEEGAGSTDSATSGERTQDEIESGEDKLTEGPGGSTDIAGPSVELNSSRLEAMQAWCAEYDATRKSVARKVSTRALQAYALWHQHSLSPLGVAGLLEPPLKTNTVNSYILEAVTSDRDLPYDAGRLKQLISSMPPYVASKYKGLLMRLDSS